MIWGGGGFIDFSLLMDPTHPAQLDELSRLFWLDVWRAPVLDAIEELGVEMRRYGPVLALVVAGLPKTPMFNLVLGAGTPGSVEDGHLRAALEWIESLGVDCRVPVVPEQVEAGAAEDLLNRRGYRRTGHQARFLRDAAPPDFPEPPGIEIVELDEFTEGFSDFAGEGFELDPSAHTFIGGLPGRDSWRCYVALDEDEWPVAGATMLLHYDVAQLGFAATKEAARNKGFHLALLRRRILDAPRARCQHLFAETEEPLDDLDGPSPGARNLVRAGFKQVAVRPVWQPPREDPDDEAPEDEDDEELEDDEEPLLR
jgi:hypothetical protein